MYVFTWKTNTFKQLIKVNQISTAEQQQFNGRSKA